MPKIEEALAETLEIANQSSTEEITVQDVIQEYIDELNAVEMQDGASTITVSQTNKKLTGIILQIEENEFKITKTNEQGIVTYTIEMNIKDADSEDAARVFMSASYQGLEQLASVNETYQFGIIGTVDGQEQKVVYNLNCTDTFKDDIQIEDFGEDEIQTLNAYDSEQIATLMMSIGERIQQVNAMQMEQIGFTQYGNPMLYAFPLTSIGLLTYSQTNNEGIVTNQEEGTNTTENDTNVNDDSNLSSDEMMNQLQQTSNDLTNATIEQYVGENRGSAIRDLLLYVSTTNASQTDENRKINVSGDIQMSGNDTEVPSDIDTSATYNVELNYDENENVNEIIITKR